MKKEHVYLGLAAIVILGGVWYLSTNKKGKTKVVENPAKKPSAPVSTTTSTVPASVSTETTTGIDSRRMGKGRYIETGIDASKNIGYGRFSHYDSGDGFHYPGKRHKIRHNSGERIIYVKKDKITGEKFCVDANNTIVPCPGSSAS